MPSIENVHKSITDYRVQDAVEMWMSGESYCGFCLACGADADGVEPDACGYTCESCKQPQVYGAEQVLLSHLYHRPEVNVTYPLDDVEAPVAPKSKPVRYLSAEKMSADDFGFPFTGRPGEVVYDAATRMGPWATMTEQSFRLHGCGLGLGRGQKYVRQPNGELHKVEG